MEKEQIDKLILEGRYPDFDGRSMLIETHISWIILGRLYAYKIKKPVHYSFLDFSGLERRKYYCEREIELNKRLTEGIYLDVQPVRKMADRYSIGYEDGEIVDYAVRMKKMDRGRQMDILLLNNQVSKEDIRNLANKIATFHKGAEIIPEKDLNDIRNKFNDLGAEKEYLRKVKQEDGSKIIENAIKISDEFNKINQGLLKERLKSGFIRDCHGDMHTRNIFLLPEPQPFDCIEFNDDYRQIDVLNEVAFMCMDLDSFGRYDLSGLFISYYNQLFATMKTEKDHQLFIYFKSYRANIRAKVNILRARSSPIESGTYKYLAETERYLHLMDGYISRISVSNGS